MKKASKFKRVWLITGVSRGLGASMAEAALDAGDGVIAAGRDLRAVVSRFGRNRAVLPVELDVKDEAKARLVAEMGVSHFGRIDVLVNNAGFGLVGAVEESSARDIRRLYETNVFGLLNVTRAVLPWMRKQGFGHVINISSVGGFRASAGFGAYCSTKFAVEGLSEALYAELAPLGIHVTVVEPGYFRTDFLDTSSLVMTPCNISDYAATAGVVRKRVGTLNHQQSGDPAKFALAVRTLVDSEKPPLRLTLGNDALTAVEQKMAFVAAETDVWREVSTSTAFGQ